MALLGLALAAPLRAEEPAGEPPAGGESAPAVSLDRLLRIPESHDVAVERRGGASPGEWRERFAGVRRSLGEERAALARAQDELDEVAGQSDAWLVGPPIPGAQPPGETPLDFRLRQEIRRRRAEIERLEREQRSLEVEANLAGVPEAWRAAPDPAPVTDP